jgi:hypothetical protein
VKTGRTPTPAGVAIHRSLSRRSSTIPTSQVRRRACRTLGGARTPARSPRGVRERRLPRSPRPSGGRDRGPRADRADRRPDTDDEGDGDGDSTDRSGVSSTAEGGREGVSDSRSSGDPPRHTAGPWRSERALPGAPGSRSGATSPSRSGGEGFRETTRSPDQRVEQERSGGTLSGTTEGCEPTSDGESVGVRGACEARSSQPVSRAHVTRITV